MGKTSWGQPSSLSDGVFDLIHILLPYVCFLRRLELRTELLLSCFSLFFSRVSFSLPQFSNPHSHSFGLIYRFPLVELSWWWGAFHVNGPFWDIFLSRWDPFLATDMTFSKLVLVVKLCSTSDFAQGTTITVPCEPRPGIDPRPDTSPKLIWAPPNTMCKTFRHTEVNGLGLSLMPVQ